MKILAIGKAAPRAALAQMMPHLRDEARHVWERYTADVVREMYMSSDRTRAVLVLELPSAAEAQRVLAELPLVAAHLFEFEVIELAPFAPLGQLFAPA